MLARPSRRIRRLPMIGRRGFIGGVALGLLAVAARAAAKVPRVGILSTGSPPPDGGPNVDPVAAGLRDLGYVEGRNLVIEHRWAEGKLDRLPALAADLVRLDVDVIVAGGVAGVRAVMAATSTIPIVMEAVTDPVGAGLVASLARPGGNVTGSATLLAELGAKRLELLKEALPDVARVGALYDPTVSPSVLSEVEVAARRLNVQVHVLKARTAEELESTFGEARNARADALSVLASPFFLSQSARIASLATAYRLPASVPHRANTEAGRLMTYGPDFQAMRRHAAAFVDKILKGAKPGDLPVEQVTTFELVINMKTAEALGLTLPPSLLLRADEVIR